MDGKHFAPYAACTYDLDDGIGILLNKIKDPGLEEKTVAVFNYPECESAINHGMKGTSL